MNVPFKVLDGKKADDLFTAPKDEQKWAVVVRELLLGRSVFVPGMNRTSRESLRSIINYHRYGMLRSRSVVDEDTKGMVLRLDRKAKV